MTTVLPRLKRLVADLFAVPEEDITPATSADTLEAWDSLKHLQLMLMLEEAFHLQISPEAMEQLTSVARIAAWLEEQAPATGIST
ncbi:MAG: acyl carrier protein [Candidatus Tectimicrobiota bacterium]